MIHNHITLHSICPVCNYESTYIVGQSFQISGNTEIECLNCGYTLLKVKSKTVKVTDITTVETVKGD